MATDNLSSNPRNYSKTFKAFITCMNIAKQGKTFIFVHHDFVAIDNKTWQAMQKKRQLPHIVYDEAGEVTQKQWDKLDKILKKQNNLPRPVSTEQGPNYFHRNYMQEPIEKPEI